MAITEDTPATQSSLHPVKHAAAVFNVSAHSFYEQIRLGAIPYYRFGRKVLVDLDEVRAALRVPPKAKGPNAAE